MIIYAACVNSSKWLRGAYPFFDNINWKPVGRPTQHKGGREVGDGSGAKSRREIWPLSLERGAARVAAAR